MEIGTELKILVDYPDDAGFYKDDIVVVTEIEAKRNMKAQIKGGEEWWFINRLMEGKHWEVAKGQK